MAASMRRTAAIPVLAASAVLLAGCGGAGHTTATTGTASAATKATAATGAPAVPVARAEEAKARAFAVAVNLKARALPGFHPASGHEHKSAAEKRLDPQLAKCVGGAGAKREATEVSSRAYER